MAESLVGSKSPFLLHGAEQPVDWLPWGDAAIKRARAEDKPILLDIGAVWCHWCHVMDRESYQDAQTAALINELFVPIKVDRDEQPDVDARYQRAVQTLTGQGGWPLTAFLTPDGETFYGGTYFPPDDRYGRPSFRRVLHEVARLWKQDRPRALDAVRDIQERLKAYAQAEVQGGELDANIVAQTVEEFAQAFDFRFGGFGNAPKFPNAGGLQLLLDHDLDTGTGWSRIVVETLVAMARGGIYDQLGGGFHRYSVDARWIIPHFEKMAYDNGPLLEVSARAARTYDNHELSEAAHGMVSHYFDVAASLLERGGFPASQDADYSPDDDGDYWTWTLDEMRDALSDDALLRTAALHYGMEDAAGSMHLDPSRHALFRALNEEQLSERLGVSVEQAAQQLKDIRTRLKRARDARPTPFVDQSVYTGWNGLVASGFLAAARHLGNKEAGPAALRALDRIWQEAFDSEHGLMHRLGDRIAGEQLEDHAHVAQALLDAFEFTQQREYMERARTLALHVESRFLDPSTGAYRDRPVDAAAVTRGLAEPTLSVADAPVPSGNGMMALVLLRLAAHLGDDALRGRGHRVLRAFAGSAARMGTAAATYVRAVAWATQPVTTVVVVGTGSPESNPLLRVALRVYRPRTIVRWLRAGQETTAELPPELQAMVTADAPRAYLCVGSSCLAPLSEPDALADALRTQH